jgi:L-iditol 2-dehydrogenase
MKCVLKERPEPGIWIREVSRPRPAHGEVLVRVKRASICGSDIGLYEFSPAYAGFAKLPTIPGHEFAGQVAELGERVNKFNVGDPVVAESVLSCGNCRLCINGQPNLCLNFRIFGIHTNGGFAEYAIVPEKHLHSVKNGLSFEQAAIIEPLSVCCHAVHDVARIVADDAVAVLGPGPIGLLAAQVARASGCEDVIVSGIDVDEARLGIASKLGFKAVNASTEDLVQTIKSACEIGVDVVIVAAGSGLALSQACDLVRKGGRILNIAIYPKPVELTVTKLVRSEVALMGTFASAWRNYEEAMELAANGKVALEPLVTHRYPVDDAHTAFEKAKAKEGCKVQLVI